jgi:hypothetical protein
MIQDMRGKEPRPLALDRGATTVYSLNADPRFSYALYVPAQTGSETSLLAIIHGSFRNFLGHRDQFAPFAEANDCIVLAPLFPVGVLGDENADGFKYLLEGELRYDAILDAMVAEVSARYALSDAMFGIAGFSGGAHFAHRYLLLHPRRLWGASVAAPGSVTLADSEADWWLGVRNLRELFGVEFDRQAIASVPVQLVIGDEDLDAAGIFHAAGSRYWMSGADDAGRNRIERLRSLEASLREIGARVTFDLLSGVGHEPEPLFAVAQHFLAKALTGHRLPVSAQPSN